MEDCRPVVHCFCTCAGDVVSLGEQVGGKWISVIFIIDSHCTAALSAWIRMTVASEMVSSLHYNSLWEFENLLFVLSVFNGTFITYRLYRHRGIKYILRRAGGTYIVTDKPNKRKIHTHTLPPGLCGDDLFTLWRCHQRGLSIANHLASTDRSDN